MSWNADIEPKRVNLALQGGGAHGAFAWGVLDKLLEDGRLEVEGLCATSAGSMNACAYAYGMSLGGPEGARAKLEEFWYKVHKTGQAHSLTKINPWYHMLGGSMKDRIDDLSYASLNQIIRTFSPYEWNPFDINPLKEVLCEVVDFEHLVDSTATKLFISTTNVLTGKVRVFRTDEITLEVVLASACLPLLFKAVEIDGEPYWDGGYTGNPSLFPLFYNTDSRDVIIIHITSLLRADTPTTAQDIINRMNEISFNSSLYKELRTIAFVKKLKECGMLNGEFEQRFKDILVHSVRSEPALYGLPDSTRMESDWTFLTKLRDSGRIAMEAWLDMNFDDVGERDTVDLQSEFTSIAQMFEQTEEDFAYETEWAG